MSFAAIISSPFQLICLNEYLKKYPEDNPTIIVLVYSEIEKRHLINLSKQLVLKIEKLIVGIKVIQYLTLFKISKKINSIDKFLIGNYFSDPHLFLYNLILPRETIIIDDGLNSYKVFDFATKKYKINLKGLKKIFKKKFLPPSKFIFFSMFDFMKSQQDFEIVKNDLQFLSKKIKSFKTIKKKFIIGQPFVELSILDFSSYMHGLNKIINGDKNFVYVPSRKEDLKNLRKIENTMGIQILKTNINIEYYLIQKKITPIEIHGFTSTALVSLDKIFNKGLRIFSHISFKMVKNSSSNYNFEAFYKYLSNNNIQIIEND